MAKIKVIQFGLGPIGAGVARVIAQRPDFQFVGAVDIDSTKVGKDLGELIGLGHDLGVKISDDAAKVLKKNADVVMHCTVSSLAKAEPQLAMIIKAGKNIVSTCEELAMPWGQKASAKRIDALAKKHKVTVLGTGINPGFMMDTLPILLTGVCQEVQAIRVNRTVDASKRRKPLQAKIGTGMTVAEFHEKAGKDIRHVGLTESVRMIAYALHWKLDRVDETIAPVVATSPVKTEYFEVQPGFVTGVEQYGYGSVNGIKAIELHLRMCVDAGESVDEVIIEGKPPIHSLIKGVHGDLSTAAVAANCVRRVVAAAPGLVTMADLPIISVG